MWWGVRGSRPQLASRGAHFALGARGTETTSHRHPAREEDLQIGDEENDGKRDAENKSQPNNPAVDERGERFRVHQLNERQDVIYAWHHARDATVVDCGKQADQAHEWQK